MSVYIKLNSSRSSRSDVNALWRHIVTDQSRSNKTFITLFSAAAISWSKRYICKWGKYITEAHFIFWKSHGMMLAGEQSVRYSFAHHTSFIFISMIFKCVLFKCFSKLFRPFVCDILIYLSWQQTIFKIRPPKLPSRLRIVQMYRHVFC